MATKAAAHALRLRQSGLPSVLSFAELRRYGVTREATRAHIAAGRWRRLGSVVVLHNGALTANERRRAALLSSGPRSALTSFTALQVLGLTGWERETIHVLVPRGARLTFPPETSVKYHYARLWDPACCVPGQRIHRVAPAAAIAAASMKPRHGSGLLAAVVQQRFAAADELTSAIELAVRVRNRAVLLAACRDIAGGAQALTEIDFARICRRARLPEPVRQTVRTEPSGRRRYLDAEFRSRTGRSVVVEVDGALHLAPRRWWDDQLRQNELVIGGDIVLRFPSAVLRCEPEIVVDQLARALRM